MLHSQDHAEYLGPDPSERARCLYSFSVAQSVKNEKNLLKDESLFYATIQNGTSTDNGDAFTPDPLYPCGIIHNGAEQQPTRPCIVSLALSL